MWYLLLCILELLLQQQKVEDSKSIFIHGDSWSCNTPLWTVKQVQLHSCKVDRSTEIKPYMKGGLSTPVHSEESSCPVALKSSQGCNNTISEVTCTSFIQFYTNETSSCWSTAPSIVM